jgi:predicted 3-demethylubiquinone-9 3-methyltransferase (glyoxalase superfamily)
MGKNFQQQMAGLFPAFNHGISVYVNCDTHAEIDNLRSKLADGGEIEACEWLRDKFGVSWQISPTKLNEWLSDPDHDNARRVSIAVFRSRKLNIAILKKADEG